jgi:hypothetical protein
MIAELVESYIERLLKHEAEHFSKDISEIDLIIRKRSELTVYVYDTINKYVLRTLSAKDIKNILT